MPGLPENGNDFPPQFNEIFKHNNSEEFVIVKFIGWDLFILCLDLLWINWFGVFFLVSSVFILDNDEEHVDQNENEEQRVEEREEESKWLGNFEHGENLVGVA